MIQLPSTPPSCIIIDEDLHAVDELLNLLQNHHFARPVGTASSVTQANDLFRLRSAPLLFIRITMWDEYLRARPSIPAPATNIVFLSGRMDKCTADRSHEVDFHLQHPYKLSDIADIFTRMFSPGFQPRPLVININEQCEIIPTQETTRMSLLMMDYKKRRRRLNIILCLTLVSVCYSIFFYWKILFGSEPADPTTKVIAILSLSSLGTAFFWICRNELKRIKPIKKGDKNSLQ